MNHCWKKTVQHGRQLSVRWLLLLLLLLIPRMLLYAQARLVLNGAKITIAQGATLVIDNPDAQGITRISGHIISEGENNTIKWNIGTVTGTYTVPWGYGDTDFIPLTFSAGSGIGNGSLVLATYGTGWQNSAQLPAGVTNFMGASGADKSVFATDRFWKILAQDYTTKPTLSNVSFTYLDAEFITPNNTSLENLLTPQRYNSNLNSWTDYATTASVNTTENTVTLSSINPDDLFTWWTINYIQDRHWVALNASNWNDPQNWSYTSGGNGGAGVPTEFDDVLFDASRDASVTLDANSIIANLTIDIGYTGTVTQGNNTLTIQRDANLSGGAFNGGNSGISIGGSLLLGGTTFTSTEATLDIKGNFTLTNGIFNHNNGTVQLSGDAGITQNITSAHVTTFYNLHLTNNSATPGVSVENDHNLQGVLTLEDHVTFDADGSNNTSIFTMQSRADNLTEDAALAPVPPGSVITGKITVQRFMTKEGGINQRIYRYISSPVQNATVADLQNEIPVTGSFSGSSTCSGCGTGASLFAYDESVITDTNGSGVADLNDGYSNYPTASNSEILNPGRGYALFVRGNILSSTAWDVRGTVNVGNNTPVPLPVTFTSSGNASNDGWNLVGNPFPSTINWNATSGWIKTNLDATIYTTDNGNSSTQYATWNGVTGTNGGSPYIAIGQGFWVKANSAAPALMASEGVKAAGIQTIFFRKKNLENILRVALVQGPLRDEAVIHFREDATSGFDAHADALKLLNSKINISTLAENFKLAINSLPALNCQSDIPLTIEQPPAGTYTFEFSEYESFSPGIRIFLYDKFMDSEVDVRSGSYTFSVTNNPATQGSTRFSLHISTQPLATDFIVKSDLICEGSNASILISPSQQNAEYAAFLNDSLISPVVRGDGGIIILPVSHSQLSADQENMITIKARIPGCEASVQKEATIHVERIYNATANSSRSCTEGILTLNASGAPENGAYNWYESETSLTPLSEHGPTLLTPFLLKSKTFYVATVNSLGCEGERIPALAEIILLEKVTIRASGDSLVSSYQQGNQWFFNHQPLYQGNSQAIKPEETGTYTVIVSNEGCQSTASFDYYITAIEETAEKIQVYPNPVSNILQIKIPDSLLDIREIRIINSLGKTILVKNQLEDKNYSAEPFIDLTTCTPGIYYVQLIGQEGVSEVKIIKI